MNLAKSVLVEVLGVISKPWFDNVRFVNLLIREDYQAKESMYKHCEWKQIDDASRQELREFRCLSIEVEHKPFVDPELDEENEEVEGVKSWHTWRIGEGREDGGQELGVSHLKDEFGTSVEILIL